MNRDIYSSVRCSEPIQPDLECLQGWSIHHLSGQPVSVPHHSYHEELLFFLTCQVLRCQHSCTLGHMEGGSYPLPSSLVQTAKCSIRAHHLELQAFTCTLTNKNQHTFGGRGCLEHTQLQDRSDFTHGTQRLLQGRVPKTHRQTPPAPAQGQR